MRTVILSAILFIPFLMTGQKFVDGFENELDVKEYKRAENPSSQDITGVYSFGESEWESELLVNKIEDKFIVQLKYGQFIEGPQGKIIKYAYRYHTFQDISFENGALKGKNFEGRFYTITTHKKIFGLHIVKTDFDMINQNEFGGKTGKGSGFYCGKYGSASNSVLTKEYLEKQTPGVLKLMRNEIYARYGYDFKAGSEMDAYFNGQSWYHPDPDFNEHKLTFIEKENIDKIVATEKLKKG